MLSGLHFQLFKNTKCKNQGMAKVSTIVMVNHLIVVETFHQKNTNEVVQMERQRDREGSGCSPEGGACIGVSPQRSSATPHS